ncbi:PKD domain-containing protein [Conexibacter woesei]|uniref:PKD domain-containing protein n=1 Tax=Conexibacter woesei TaxID=191495 RepID=UPI00041FF67B|nr:PKD domain-containing protein [Conexibacter woesei]
MRRRLAFIVTTIAVLAVPVGSAQAAFFKADAVDGPSADIKSVGDMDIARDGTGAVAYVKADGGVNHIFVSRLVGGSWQAPERVDGGLDASASTPAVAASDGGRLVVVYEDGGSVYATVRQAGAPGFNAPQLIGQGGETPDVDMSFNGNAYAVFTINGDVVGARLDRTGVNFVGLTAPFDTAQGNTAGVGTGRPKIAVSADGTGVVVWGENGHVYARRVFNTAPSTSVLDLNLSDLEGHPGGTADLPDVDIEDDSSYAWVAFRQQFDNGVRRAIGVRLRGSRTDPPVAYDGLGWSGVSADDPPRVDINGKGVGVLTSGASNGTALSAILKDDILNPARAIGGTGGATEPVGAVAETYDRAVGWYNQSDQTIQGAFYDDKSSSRLVPGPGPTTPLSNPDFGTVDPAGGFDVAGDRTGDFAFAFIQQLPDGGRRLAIASYDRLPGSFAISTSSKLWRNVIRTPLAWGTALELWGNLTYTVLIDGRQVAQSQTTKLTLPAGAVPDGLHTWRVVATDRRGQSVTTVVKPLKIDTTAPTVTFAARRKKRVETVTARAADVIPPSGKAAGIRYVRIDWGDGSAFTQATKATHTYARGGTYTVRVSATDGAGNVAVAEREIHVSKK